MWGNGGAATRVTIALSAKSSAPALLQSGASLSLLALERNFYAFKCRPRQKTVLLRIYIRCGPTEPKINLKNAVNTIKDLSRTQSVCVKSTCKSTQKFPTVSHFYNELKPN